MRKSLIELFATHRVAANLLMLIMIIGGAFALSKINTQFLPTFDLNFINVTIDWSGANAEDIERAIVVPIEDEIRDVDNVKKVTSRSRLGSGKITIEFNSGTDMIEALDQVKQRVSQVKNLPEESDPPIINRIVPYEEVARLIVAGSKNLDELRPLIHKFERELLNQGIAKINITGLPKQEIAIEVPAKELASLHVSLEQIARQISDHSRDIPAGSVGKHDVAQELRGLNQKRTVKGFAKLPILHDNQGRLIRLGDIATITRRAKSTQTHVSYKEKPAVELTLFRTENSNALTSAKILNKWLAEIRPTLPKGISVTPYFESWKLIKERINLLLKNAFWGLLLILLLLFLLLNIRTAFWVAVGIPASFLAAIAVLYLIGGSINMVSLFAMIMTLGIIIDDSIVVGEEVLSQLQKKTPLLEAVKKGTHMMVQPIMASSLTTIAAFLPLMIVGGIIGQILFDIPLIAICVIIASLIECFLVLPGHLYQSGHKLSPREPILQKYFMQFREKYFRRFIAFTLNHAWYAISISFGLIIITLGIVLSGHLKFNFFPAPEGTRIQVNAQFAAGTPEKVTKAFLQSLENSLIKTNDELSKRGKSVVVAHASFQNRSTVSRDGLSKHGEQYASMNIELISADKRWFTNEDFIQAWRNNIILPAGLESFTISAPRAGPPGRDIDIAISGDNLQSLKTASTELRNILDSMAGVSNVTDDLPFGKNHILYTLNSQAHALQLTNAEVGKQLRAAFNGKVVQIFHEPNDEIEVRIMLPNSERYQTGILESLPIVTPNKNIVPLGSVVSLKTSRGFDELTHRDSKLTVQITADVDAKVSNTNEILQALNQKVIPELKKKYDVKVAFGGRAEEQAETIDDMLYGLVIALTLIYIILAWTFSSYGWPLLIMAIIPLGLVGAIWGHIFMGIDVTILSLFGLFGLSGIVINDSIILINRYKKLRHYDTPFRQSIIDAACQRLRPVILTSITTIAGLLPLLFETSLQAQFLIPMAVSIVFGLMLATGLILILVPSMLYLYEHRSNNKRKKQT